MNRRQLVQYIVGTFVPIAGCGGDYIGDGPPARNLDLAVREVRPTNDEFRLTVEFSNVGYREDRVDDIELLAYSERGERVCTEHVGALESGGTKESVTVTCSSFPEIVTAEAATSVCDDIIVELSYWVGTNEQQSKHIPDELPDDAIVYNTTTRECGESLPPERLVNESSSPTGTGE